METALVEVVTEIEKGMTNRGLVLIVLLDINGEFIYTTEGSICLGHLNMLYLIRS